MKKLILTAAIVFTVGVLSLLNTTNTSKKISLSTARVMLDDRIVLATAD